MAPRFQLLPLSTPAAPALPTPLGLPTLASTDTNRPAAAARRIRDRFAVIFNLSKISNQTLFQVAGDSDSSKFLWLNESKLVWGRGCWTMKKIPSLFQKLNWEPILIVVMASVIRDCESFNKSPHETQSNFQTCRHQDDRGGPGHPLPLRLADQPRGVPAPHPRPPRHWPLLHRLVLRL